MNRRDLSQNQNEKNSRRTGCTQTNICLLSLSTRNYRIRHLLPEIENILKLGIEMLDLARFLL